MWPQLWQRTMSASAVPKLSVVGINPSVPIWPLTRNLGSKALDPHAMHVPSEAKGPRIIATRWLRGPGLRAEPAADELSARVGSAERRRSDVQRGADRARVPPPDQRVAGREAVRADPGR